MKAVCVGGLTRLIYHIQWTCSNHNILDFILGPKLAKLQLAKLSLSDDIDS